MREDEENSLEREDMRETAAVSEKRILVKAVIVIAEAEADVKADAETVGNADAEAAESLPI